MRIGSISMPFRVVPAVTAPSCPYVLRVGAHVPFPRGTRAMPAVHSRHYHGALTYLLQVRILSTVRGIHSLFLYPCDLG